MAEWIERSLLVLGDHRIQTHGFEPRSSQANDVNFMLVFITQHSALIRYGKDWLAECLAEWLVGDFILSEAPNLKVGGLIWHASANLDVHHSG